MTKKVAICAAVLRHSRIVLLSKMNQNEDSKSDLCASCYPREVRQRRLIMRYLYWFMVPVLLTILAVSTVSLATIVLVEAVGVYS